MVPRLREGSALPPQRGGSGAMLGWGEEEDDRDLLRLVSVRRLLQAQLLEGDAVCKLRAMTLVC